MEHFSPGDKEAAGRSLMIDTTDLLRDTEVLDTIADYERQASAFELSEDELAHLESLMNRAFFQTTKLPRRVEISGIRYTEDGMLVEDIEDIAPLSKNAIVHGVSLTPLDTPEKPDLIATFEIEDFDDRCIYYYPVFDTQEIKVASQSIQVESMLKILDKMDQRLHYVMFQQADTATFSESLGDYIDMVNLEIDKYIPPDESFRIGTKLYYVLPTGRPNEETDLTTSNNTAGGAMNAPDITYIEGTFSGIDVPIAIQPDLERVPLQDSGFEIDPFEPCIMLYNDERKCQFGIPLSSIQREHIYDGQGPALDYLQKLKHRTPEVKGSTTEPEYLRTVAFEMMQRLRATKLRDAKGNVYQSLEWYSQQDKRNYELRCNGDLQPDAAFVLNSLPSTGAMEFRKIIASRRYYLNQGGGVEYEAPVGVKRPQGNFDRDNILQEIERILGDRYETKLTEVLPFGNERDAIKRDFAMIAARLIIERSYVEGDE